MLGLGALGTEYNALTNVGTIDIGSFDSFDAAYQWAAARYGNDFLGVEPVPVIKPPVTPPPPASATSYVPWIIAAAVVIFIMSKK